MELALPFLTGVVSFISPCIIPMIIVYLTTITGFSFDALLRDGGSAPVRRQLFAKTLVFVLAFTLVFTAVGAAAAALAGAMPAFFGITSLLAGVLFVILGLHYLGLLKDVLWRFGGMMDDEKLQKATERWRGEDGALSYAGVFLVGAIFALVCSHCISPTLFPTLMLAASTQDTFAGGLIMLAFSAGLGLSFLLASLFFSRTMESLKLLQRHQRAVRLAVGAIFIVMGLLLLSGQYLSFVSLLYRAIPWRGIGM
ncbi:MAG: cytochrome c biogenesis protein CcdA [Candidatus Micrarchaeota archaeon]